MSDCAEGFVESQSSGVRTAARQARAATAVIFLLALILRSAWMFYAQPEPVSDFEDYRKLAEGLLDQHQYGYPVPTAVRTPGFPLVLAGMMLVSRSPMWLSAANVILSSVTCILVYFATRNLFRRSDIAVFASLIYALNPTFVAYSSVLASENVFPLLVLGATILATHDHPLVHRHAVPAGLLMGMAILTRPEALFYLPIVCALFLRPSSNGERWSLSVLRQPLVVVVASVCVILPWYIRNQLVVGPGSGLGTNGGLVFYQAHNPNGPGYMSFQDTPLESLDEVTRSEEGYRLGIAYIRSAPLSLIKAAITNTVGLYRPGTDAIEWSTRTSARTSPGNPWLNKPLALLNPWSNKPLALLSLSREVTKAFYAMLASLFVLSLLTIRDWPYRAVIVIGGFLTVQWVLYAVVFWGSERFRYFPEVLFCICGGIVISKLLCRRGATDDRVYGTKVVRRSSTVANDNGTQHLTAHA